MSRRNEKAEEELAQAIKKALSADESAPKQKHVRSAILYTWDMQGSGSFWVAIKSFPLLGDEVVSFKALILIHKVIRQGHPSCLKDGITQGSWLQQLARQVNSYAGSNYSPLVRGYISYLSAKLDFHSRYPAFSGTFDYEEYVSLRGVDDPDEGFETIHDLLELLAKLDTFQKLIFSNLRAIGNNEARIAALVPLVEESNGLYQFVQSMMTAMHQIIGSVEVLAPLRLKFKQSHYALVQFYEDCSGLKYLTSLISIPKLPHDPPDFLENGQPTIQPKNNKKKENDDDAQKRYLAEQQRLELQKMQEQELEMQRLEQQRLLELENERQRRQDFEMMQRQEQERFRLLQQQQEQQLIQSRLLDANSQLEYLRNQHLQDRNMLEQYNMKVQQLEQQLSQMNFQNTANSGKDETIKKLEQEIAQWKQKYEALAKLYAQLRKEHLDLLQKFKTIKDQGVKANEETRKETEKAKNELKAKSEELTQVLIERNRLRGDADRIKLQYEEEIQRLRNEITQSKAALQDISSSKGAEVANIVSRFTAEQSQLENLIQSKVRECEQLRIQMQDMMASAEREKMANDEEKQILQASLDQALLVLAQHQQQSQSGMGQRDVRITELEQAHRQLLNQMMDNVLQTCVNTVQDAIFTFDSPGEGSKASPEYILSLIERAQQKCTEFAASFVKLVNGGDPKDAINTSSSFAQAVAQLLIQGKEANVSATDEEDSEDIINLLRESGQATSEFFQNVMSRALLTIPADQKPQHILNFSRQTQLKISSVSPLLEKLVSKPNLVGDLETIVEREMNNAAKAIEEATTRLQILMTKSELNVHGAILQSAMAMMTAIANLVKCATASQQEIVSQGKGSTTHGAFYKKNNKWTDGLISAAQSVATATTYLVEVADGLVQSTHSWEQLVVAAQEVSVATTQLVAASRVKAVQFSKTQDRLENAAHAVREAVKLLVKAAKEAAKLVAESNARQQILSMSKHEAKVKEMEQQVKILELEKQLQTARYQLGEMRKQGYHAE